MFYIISIYILSVISTYWYIRLTYYHPKGVDKGKPIESLHYWLTFFPIVNTFVSLGWFIVFPIEIDYIENNIFKPKSKK